VFNKIKPKSEFTKNVLTLLTGTTIAQAIPIAISPILTRMYTPEDFGLLSLYIGIVSFITIAITGRYELSIVLPKNDKEAINIVALSFFIMMTIVFISFILIIIFKSDILLILNAKNLGNILYLVPLSLFFAGIYQIFNYWSNRKRYFQNISKAQILQSVTVSSSQVLFSILTGLNGLILGNILGRFVSMYIVLKNFLLNDVYLIKYINRKKIKQLAKKYKEFPLVNTFHAFSDIIRISGSVILISSFWGATTLGFYALSIRVLQIPVGIVGSALGQVLYQKFSIMYNNEEELLPYVKNIIFKLFIIAFPLFLLLFIIAPELFAFIFGEKWRIAGEYTQILMPYLFMNFLISPISQLPIIIRKQKEIFYISLIGNMCFILILFMCKNIEFILTLKILVIFMCIYYLYVLIWIRKVLV